jgi:hypothetical protein
VVAQVNCNGADVNANAEQVRAGMARVFDRYARDGRLYSLQTRLERGGGVCGRMPNL